MAAWSHLPGAVAALLPLFATLAAGAAPAGVPPPNPALAYVPPHDLPGARIISRSAYLEQLQGFWLGQCIANWTGLVTELDKIGPAKTGPFYTRADWGRPDQPNIWSQGQPSPLSPPLTSCSSKREVSGARMTTPTSNTSTSHYSTKTKPHA